MNLTEIKTVKGKINGQPASLLKMSDYTKSVWNIFYELGYVQHGDYLYKIITEDYKFWLTAVKDNLKSKFSKTEFSSLGNAFYSPAQITEKIDSLSTLEQLNNMFKFSF